MLLPFPIAPLESGVIVGHTTSTTTRVLARVPNDAPHTLRIAGRALPVRADRSRDRTAIIDVAGLSPAREYPFDLVDATERSVLPDELRPRVRTLPTDCERLCFAFVSCHLPFARSGLTASVGNLDALITAIDARDVRFVLHLGDQIYADPPDAPELDAWRFALEHPDVDKRSLYNELYRAYFAVPAMRRLHARVPNLMIWDDGEIRDVWGARALDGAEATIAPAMFDAARAAYVDYQHAHNPPTIPGDLHYSFDAGPASFFVLDLRGQRDVTRRRVLGERQWAALEAWIAGTERRAFRFLVSSVPLLHAPDGLVERVTRHDSSRVHPALYDRWSADAFHHELERLLALILPRRIIVLSGDIHIGAASEILDPNDRHNVVHQWISSAITHESGLVHRLESEVMSRLAHVGSPWPVVQRFDELRNNFGIVELVRAGGRWNASFDLYVHTGGTSAKPLYRVEVASPL